MNGFEAATKLVNMALVQEDGTIDTIGDPLPLTGFYVGGVRPSLVYSVFDQIDRGDVGWFVGGTDARYFGVWTDTETGNVYIDAVTHVKTRKEALALGAERGEIAVWDILNSEEVRIKDAQSVGDDN